MYFSVGDKCKSASGLILFFCGKSKNDGELKMFDGNKENFIELHHIWCEFYSEHYPHLKNKAKIFIFEVSDHHYTKLSTGFLIKI